MFLLLKLTLFFMCLLLSRKIFSGATTAENIFHFKDFELIQFSKQINESAELNCTLFFTNILKLQAYKGLKLDIIFNYPFKIKVVNAYGSNYQWEGSHYLQISISDFSASLIGYIYKYINRIVEFQLLAENFIPNPNNTIGGFYVNEERLFGSLTLNYGKQNSVSQEGQQQPCSSFIRVQESKVENIVNVTFSYFSNSSLGFESVNLIFTYQQKFSNLTAHPYYISQQNGNIWMLQNYGVLLKSNKTLTINIMLVANKRIRNPYPDAISLNGNILCYLPTSYINNEEITLNKKGSSEINKPYDQNENIFVALIFLASIQTLLLVGGFCIAIYIFVVAKRWKLFYKNEQIEINNLRRQVGQSKNRFGDFVAGADYVNAESF